MIYSDEKKEVFESKNVIAAKADEDEGCLVYYSLFRKDGIITNGNVLGHMLLCSIQSVLGWF